jgi:D-glycero-D-manno-heptose 1,7-bisphosphate phosphatase
MRAAVFLERDGVLNHARVERLLQASPRTLDEFKIKEEAIEPLRALKEAGFLLLATTNQPGLSRGYQSRRELDLMHNILQRRFALDDMQICPHDEMDRCPCRKPKPGLLTEAAFKWKLDLDRCFVISEKWQDAEAAHNAGCTSLLIKSPWNGSGHRDFILPDLQAVVHKILQIQLGMLASNEGPMAMAQLRT